jgi:hypothetical protein
MIVGGSKNVEAHPRIKNDQGCLLSVAGIPEL